jgi:plastocyanin
MWRTVRIAASWICDQRQELHAGVLRHNRALNLADFAMEDKKMRACERVVLVLSMLNATCGFGATHTVQVGQSGNAFSSSSITIPAGDTITFVNTSGGFHNAVSYNGTAFNNGVTSGSWTFVTPPITTNTDYRCTVHGFLSGGGCSGMCGSITVTVPVRLQSFEVD